MHHYTPSPNAGRLSLALLGYSFPFLASDGVNGLDPVPLSHSGRPTIARMRFSNALGPLVDLCHAIGASLWPTIVDVYNSPSLLFRPAMLSEIVMAHVWVLFGNPTDEGGRPTKKGLITPNAHGVVLDIGAGTFGLTLKSSLRVLAFSPLQVMVTPQGTLIGIKSRNTTLWNRTPGCTHTSGLPQTARVSRKKTGRWLSSPVALRTFRPSSKLQGRPDLRSTR